MSSLPELKPFIPKTDKEIYAELHPLYEKSHVYYYHLRNMNAECGCSHFVCMSNRYTRTEKNHIFDVVKMINGKITVVMNDVVIKVDDNKVDDNKVEEIVTIETNKKGFSI